MSGFIDDEKAAQYMALMRAEFSEKDGYGLDLDDHTFLRYLRARKYDVHKAINMLQDTLKWRESYGLANISSWFETMVLENATGKTYVRGHDKDGHPIIVMKPRNENTFSNEDNMRHLVYNLERAVACVQSNDRKFCILVDFEGFSLLNAPPLKVSMDTLNVLQNHYPERLHRCFLLRPPWIFLSAFNVISPFIDPVTADKIIMCRSSKEKMRECLTLHIDEQKLEGDFGGSDERPFDSQLYLQCDMSMCFWTSMQNHAAHRSTCSNTKEHEMMNEVVSTHSPNV